MENRYNLSNLEALFKDFLRSKHISKISIKNYLSDVRHFISWVMYQVNFDNPHKTHLDIFLEVVDSTYVSKYIQYLQENSIPVSTINRRLSSLRKLFDFCLQRELIQTNIMTDIRNLEKPLSHSSSVQNLEEAPRETKTLDDSPYVLATEDFTKFLNAQEEVADEVLLSELHSFLE